MKRITLQIGGKIFNVQYAETPLEQQQGLMGVKQLAQTDGMFFPGEQMDDRLFWMKNTEIPLDVIFIDEDGTVILVVKPKPLSEDYFGTVCKDVLELNKNSGVKVGDKVEIVEGDKQMYVLDPKGKTQMQLEGGERIFSRSNTVSMIKLAKKANKTKSDEDYKRLGLKVILYLDIQDSNKPEYVKSPK